MYLYKNNRLFSKITTSNHVIKELYNAFFIYGYLWLLVLTYDILNWVMVIC